MTEEMYVTFRFKIDGDDVRIKKEGNVEEVLPNLEPKQGVYMATLLLAWSLVLHRDDKMLDVIKMLGTPEDYERVASALKAVQMLLLAEELKEAITNEKESGDNGTGKYS